MSFGGYPTGYELSEGNKSETKTLIPVLESFKKKFELEKPIVIADAALLSQKNIDACCRKDTNITGSIDPVSETK